MADKCTETRDGVKTAKPPLSRATLETFGALSITEEKVGSALTYTITTEFCHVILRSGKSLLVDDRKLGRDHEARKLMELPEAYSIKVAEAVQAGLKDCKFDPANTLVEELFNTYLQPTQKPTQKIPPRERH